MDARQFFEMNFTPYRISNNGNPQGLFTGYYLPLLYGSRTPDPNYPYAVYQPPKNMTQYSRADIDNGALKNQSLELAWVDDPVMLFFMQVQGSGRIRFADGQEMLLAGYGGKNGREYRSLGKIMGEQHLLPKDGIDFFTIRQWLYDHPEQATKLMQQNPSYVFFKPMTTQQPVGAMNVELQPERSIAVDNRFMPYGLPVF